ncbi:helicase-exonuclease AddAB subunit AddB [Fictibacillus gelatini]|uniref:helicase-exonuclease AddAB subunit AddB n=1 Tax=Fictibacillus gelatini TaxID=225985 RepID=UPI0004103502|nr:helicase-exonuclease AddAB subunit AddB [Fictibacillus gelatini]
MSLRLFLGRSGSGKTFRCLEEIRANLREDANGSPIVYLVPDQATFQSEYALIQTPDLGGMIRAQVFSFSRLAWRVLGETGGMTRIHISSIGIHMMLRKIIELRKNELKLYKKASEQNGFYEQLETMITEFKRYCIHADQLESHADTLLSFSDQNGGNAVLKDKLHDLGLIYGALEETLIEKYIDSEDYLRLLAEKIPHSAYIKDCEIYIDGFHSFTPQELEVLRMLLRHARKVTMALTTNDEAAYQPHELDLFYTTKKTLLEVQKLAEEEGVMIEAPEMFREMPRFRRNPAIAHIERHYDTRPEVIYENPEGIFILAAVNARAEVEGIAREILHLVREEKYRYRDIAISIRNMAGYQDIIETVFEEYGIPVFLDQKKSMLHHPLIEFIRSSLDIVSKNWRYESVFRAVKTDLLYPESETPLAQLRFEMDELENYVLAYGIQGKRWTERKPWKVHRFQAFAENEFVQTDSEKKKQERLNELRYMIVSPLSRLERDLKKGKSVREYCEALYLFLEELHIPEKLEQLQRRSEEAGKLQAAREHRQVWDAVIGLLDEMVELTGGETMPLELWIKVLDTGLESLKFALVPPALDQVLVGTIGLSRFSNIKCHFIPGVNDGLLPAKPKEDGILAEEERELLERNGLTLAPSSRRQLLDEQFLIYMSLTNAEEKLYLSYPLADEEGKTMSPSIVIERVKALFPSLKERFIQNEPEYGADLTFIQHPGKSLSYLNGQLREWKKGYAISTVWWDVYNWAAKRKEWKQLGEKVIGGLFYQNKERRLPSGLTKELYGEQITASISRMELFRSCPFSQFLSYGLKLEERKLYRLEAPDIGQLFHAALKEMNDHLTSLNMSWKDLSAKDCYRMAGDMVERLAPKLQSEILLSSHRHLYLKRKLKDVVGRASHVLSEHAKASGFAPIGLELGFGKRQPLPPLVYQLPNGTTMEIIGRIDRVDAAESSSGLMLRIIDYKSSTTGLNLSEVYYGIALQMLTYLDVVVSHSEKWLGKKAIPAGVLYFHIHNPFIGAKKLLSLEELEHEIYKDFKMKGLVLADTETVQLMDNRMEKKSDIIPVELTSKGFHKTRSQVATAEQFRVLTNYVRKLTKEIGTEITDGKIDISPYQLGKKMPCTFCSYRSVCQFDQSLEENEVRLLKADHAEAIIAKMAGEGDHQNE